MGGTTTFDIGNDVNIKGGVINTDRAQGAIGGDVNIESLQDTATYDSKQKNMGFNADLDLKGAGSSLSVNGGKTNLKADYKGVGEQSGIFIGDGGFDIAAGGKTTLIGGAITTTEAARDAGRNRYTSADGIKTQDINNTTSYDGDAIQAGLSLGQTNNKPQASMNGLGYGTDSDSDSSVTRAGITGIAGSQDITTDNRAEYAGILENSFDAGRVNEELGAQTEITQAFDQERRKVKTEINAKEKKLRDEAEEASNAGDYETAREKFDAADKLVNQGLLFVAGAIYGPNSNGATGYVAKAVSPAVSFKVGQYYKELEANQDNKLTGGQQAGHILAHTLLGAAVSYATGNDVLTGSVSAGTGEAAAPLLSQLLYEKDTDKLTAEQKDTISSIVSALGAGIGATAGNASDAANAAETSKVAAENNDGGPQTYGQSKAELMKETWEMNNGPIGKLLNKNQKYILIGTDFLPVFGDIKGLNEAKSALDYVFASAAIIPVIGDGAKLAYKEAKASGSLEDVMKAKDLVEKDIKKSGLATEVSGTQLIRKVENGEKVKPIIDVQAGSKNNWDRQINQPSFQPNKQYRLSNGHKYLTDSKGRVHKVEGELSLNKMDRNKNQQRNAGKAENATGDDGGHLIASSLGGAGDRINMVPQARTLNRGDWKAMENFARRELEAGKNVSIKVDLKYPSSNSGRPNEFNVTVNVDGKVTPFKFNQ